MLYEVITNLARQDQSWGPTFSMTVLALKMSGKHNGVSKLHGEVSRRMWTPDDLKAAFGNREDLPEPSEMSGRASYNFV